MSIQPNKIHRFDIDFMRAVAVFLVIIYHLRFNIGEATLLPGGYIGVDVFFVISGYLITGNIYRKIKKDDFSFYIFYKRRFFRLVPPMLVVIIFTILVSMIILTPFQIRELVRSALSSVLFWSNIFFGIQDSYTAEISQQKPLLHIWSLSVEEQFYFIVPILMVFCFYIKSNTFKIMTFFTVISFFLALFFSKYSPQFSYFFIGTRFWEMGVGALAAIYVQNNPNHRKTDDRMSFVALALILVFGFFVNNTVPHPHYITLLPVLATTFILLSNNQSVIWENAVMQTLGRWSYSIYLVHWPIIAILNVMTGGDWQIWMYAIVFSCSVVVGGALHYLVEKPIRYSNSTLRQSLYSSGLLLVTASLIVLCWQGANWRYDGQASQVIATATEVPPIDRTGRVCKDAAGWRSCEFYPEASKKFVSIGDSHSIQFRRSYIDYGKENDTGFASLDWNNCLTIDGLVSLPPSYKVYDKCNQAKEFAHNFLLETDPSVILYSSRLNIQMTGTCYTGSGSKPCPGRIPAKNVAKDFPNLSPASLLEMRFRQYLEVGHTVIVIDPLYQPRKNVPSTLLTDLGSGFDWQDLFDWLEKTAIPSTEVDGEMASVDEVLSKLSAHPNFYRIDLRAEMCRGKKCYLGDRERLYFTDASHLATEFAADLFKTKIEPLLRREIEKLEN